MDKENVELQLRVDSLQSTNRRLSTLAIRFQNEDSRKELIIRHKDEEIEKATREVMMLRKKYDDMNEEMNKVNGEMDAYIDRIDCLKEDLAEKLDQIDF